MREDPQHTVGRTGQLPRVTPTPGVSNKAEQRLLGSLQLVRLSGSAGAGVCDEGDPPTDDVG